MKSFILEPEVAGVLGGRTKFDRSGAWPRVIHLHYVFEGWDGDEILECTPVFLTTERVKDCIQWQGITGVTFGECEIESSETFRELNPMTVLPKFAWTQLSHPAVGVDLSMTHDRRLMASEREWKILQEFMSHARLRRM